ncbi:hypothetical protein ASG73_06070 [Janibacter sp. Soil728]|uniref:hypothetical protein n=1 Tax=Janibacter sp. Soil728 TaxID=1736393 RepID=UPI0006F956EB|nr:hypothetical protein [Janibacter sp. Soil728]KRE38494.1 hypothetical protein ASG73_06070 [Janibacter sp. Soil728]
MSNLQRKTAPDRARKIAGDLQAVGVDLPSSVVTALAHLDVVEKMRPQRADAKALAQAYATADTKAVDRVALDLATITDRLEAWTEGRILAGIAVLADIRANGDDLVTALAAVAEPLMAAVTQAAAVETHDLNVLIRNGRGEEAEGVARLDINATDLAAMYALRGMVTAGAEYAVSGWDCGTWSDPRPVRQALTMRPATGPVDLFVRGVRAGAQLWFPTPAQAQAAATEVHAAERAKASAAADSAWSETTGAKRGSLMSS